MSYGFKLLNVPYVFNQVSIQKQPHIHVVSTTFGSMCFVSYLSRLQFI